MGDAGIAAEMMLEKDPSKINEQVQQLIQYNRDRKQIQEKAFQQCIELVEADYKDKPVLVLFVKDIHEGIAGIVAGKLKEKYEKPVILVTPSGDKLKGTGRSIPGINLYDLLHAYDYLFTKFGGHAGACGFSMENENFEKLAELLEADIAERLEADPDLLGIPVEVDMELEGEQITIELAKELDKLAPFGSGNPKPVFLLEQAELLKVTPMGDGRHAKFTAICSDGYAVECVLFGRAREFEEVLYGGYTVDLVGTVDWQEWRGRERVQFTVEDIR